MLSGSHDFNFTSLLRGIVNLEPDREVTRSARDRPVTVDQDSQRFDLVCAVFREGPFAGNDVPLVSRYTGSAGVSWNIWQNYLVADATVRAWSERFMDNDQANTQRLIPASATVDFKLSGAYEHFFWSISVNNIFDAMYYDYAVASTFTPGRFSAYPLQGRTYMVKAGATF